MSVSERFAKALVLGVVSSAYLAGCAGTPAGDASSAGAAEAAAAARARNVILFIGDGMGVSTVTAARIFDGQARGLDGEEHALVFEEFPNVALVKTYNTNQQVPDSAGTATAMMTGRKTRAGVINVAADIPRRDCAGALASPLEPISVKAKRRGMAVGVVTTTRITHATPATVYASLPERDWESDRFLPEADRVRGCRDMARQLVDFDAGGGLDVAMGGGRAQFFGGAGERRDADADLVSEWLAGATNRAFVQSRSELAGIGPGTQVLGLFADSHLTYVASRPPQSAEPTLAEMTAAAIDLLADDADGYFLMVEGGRIDHGHHDGKPAYALLETQAFARAIEAALAKIDLDETLVLVTADHSHVFTIAGYPTRGNPILGLVVENDTTGAPQPGPTLDVNGVPYTTLGYTNGPGSVVGWPRTAPDTGIHAVSQALITIQSTELDGSDDFSETHGGEDVALYGIGPGADRVRGVIEQNRIYGIMTDALGWE
jgi:alkaline phosphatase